MTPQTIDEVIAQLDQIILRARHDRSRLGFFPTLYRNVTIKVKAFKLCLPINARRLANTPNGSWGDAFKSDLPINTPRLANTPNSSWGMFSSPAYEANAAKTRKYPQRQLGDAFKSDLPINAPRLANTSNGSWGIVQVQPCLACRSILSYRGAARTAHFDCTSRRRRHFNAPRAQRKVGLERSPNCRWRYSAL
jgi:hypothetical protein